MPSIDDPVLLESYMRAKDQGLSGAAALARARRESGRGRMTLEGQPVSDSSARTLTRSSGRESGGSQPLPGAGQVGSVASSAADSFGDLGALGKGLVILGIVLVGLSLYGRWTGRSFQLDVLGRNALGDNIVKNQEAFAARMVAVNPDKAAAR